jgi:hypothetical protein
MYTVNEGTVVVKVDGVIVNKVSGDNLDALDNRSHTVAVEAIDAAGNINTASVTFTVNYSPLSLSTTGPPDGTEGIAYNQTLTASGGVPPYNFSLINGTTLPEGLSLTNTGAITGTPAVNTSGTSFQVQVTDSDGAVAVQQYTMAINSPLQVTVVSLPDGYLTSSYNAP